MLLVVIYICHPSIILPHVFHPEHFTVVRDDIILQRGRRRGEEVGEVGEEKEEEEKKEEEGEVK